MFEDDGYEVVAYDELERDCDEAYEPEPAEDRYLDSYYEDQYDLGDY